MISLYHSVYNSSSSSYSGTLVATYKYDTWGKPLGIYNASGAALSQTSLNVAALNPFRYRSYRYDAETGFYYLQSRYYDPEIGRFINADSYTSTGQDFLGYNMFAYCGNNPVCGVDASGASWWHWVAAAAITAVAIGAVVVTAGGAAPALFAMSCVANGVAVGSTAVTVTAGVAVGAGTALAVSAYSAANEADTLEEFSDYGEAALVGTVVGGAVGGITANNLSGHSCFIAGTQICTEFSSKNIEDIEVGDYVWAWDEESGDVALKPVVETYINESDELVHIFVNGEEIISTPPHPFYSPVKGWTDAVHLRAGDILVLVNGEYVVVEKVQHEILESPVKVYNFQVADFHTYYVANAGVLVHNKCPNPNGRKGSQAHQNKIREIGDDLQSKGYSVEYEYRVDSTGGYKNTRYIDVYGTKGTDSIGVQVGRMTANGLPVARERRALEDIIRAGINVIFKRY